MNLVNIISPADGTALRPGQRLAGNVAWQLDTPVSAVVLTLYWTTLGKGTTDTAIAEELRFENPAPREQRAFELQIPEGPCSFSGKLVSLLWLLEMRTEPATETAQVELVISPSGSEIDITAEPAKPT